MLKLKDGVSLDHEAEATIDVTVTATDSGGLSTSESFTLQVADINEGPVAIGLDGTTLDENAEGAKIGTLATKDPDAGDAHSYTVSDDRFEVVDGTLKLKDGIALDHEAEPTVDVTVTATDSGGLATSETFTLSVTDVNEGPVAIGLDGTTLDENAEGATVGSLATKDPDAGDTHSYTVSDDRFEVVDGTLKLKDGIALDHEAEPTVDVTVTAMDSGGLSTSERFTLSVTDVNEGPVAIGLDGTTLDENAAGATVGSLATKDPDAGDTHSYTVSDDRFEVVDGTLKLKDGIALDHEVEPTVDVTVTATDSGGLATSETFTLSVADVNESPLDLSLTPNALPTQDMAFWYDGADLDGDGTVDAMDGRPVDTWVEKSGNANDARLGGGGAVQDADGVRMSETQGAFDAGAHATVNNSRFSEKSIAVAFETGEDVSGFQVVFEQGGTTRGYNLSIAENPDTGEPTLYAFVYNRAEWDDAHAFKPIDMGPVEAGRSYSVVMVHDATAEDLADRTFTAYLDGEPAGQLTHVEMQYPHGASVGIGGIQAGTVHPVDFSGQNGAPFSGTVSELASWNRALPEDEIGAVDSYLQARWTPEDAPSDPEAAQVAENQAGATVGELASADPDAGDSHSYTVSDDRFEIVDNTLKLKDGVSLDHEAEASVEVTVTATDGGGLSTSETFRIAVGDVADDNTAATPDLALGSTSRTVFSETFEAWSGLPDGSPAEHVSAQNGWSSDGAVELRSEGAGGNGSGPGSVQHVELNTDPADYFDDAPNLARSVDTSDGATYTISFDYAPRPGFDASVNRMEVVWDGRVVATVSADGSDHDALNWQTHSLTVTGDGDPAEIEFREAGDDVAGGRGMMIDNIEMTEVLDGAARGEAGEAIDLPGISAGLTDLDGSETLAVTIAALPEGTVLGDGTHSFTATAGDTTADVTGWNLDALSLAAPEGFSGTMELSVTATATGTAGGDTASTTLAMPVTVDSDDPPEGETIRGDYRDDRLAGTAGSDSIDGGSGNDVIDGGAGDDRITASDGNDTIDGGDGDDHIDGGSNHDRIDGGAGDDTIIASDGNDTIDGGDGDDLIDAGHGNDDILGIRGNDTIDGGTGNDLFELDAPVPGDDWTAEIAGGWGRDTLDLSNLDDWTVVTEDGKDYDIETIDELDRGNDPLSGSVFIDDQEVASFEDIEKFSW